jgi:ATP-binding cassette subfamily B multidrug efflux pump
MITAAEPRRAPQRGRSVRAEALWSLVKPRLRVLAAAVVSMLASAALNLVPPLIMRRLIDDNLTLGRYAGLASLALTYLAAMAGVYLLDFVTTYLTSVAAQRALHDLRVRLFAHLTRLPTAYYDRTPLGDVISRCTADMDTISSLFSSGLISLLTQAVRIVSTFAAMVALSLRLSLVMVLVLPLLYALTRAFQVRMREAERAVRRAVGALNAQLQESLAGVEVLRAFHWEGRAVQRFRRALQETLVVSDRSIGLGAIYSPLLNILEAVIVAALFWLSASPLFKAAQISLGDLTAFVLLFGQFFEPLINIGNEWQGVQSALAGLERVLQVLELPADRLSTQPSMEGDAPPASAPPASAPQDAPPLVRVEQLSFGYAEGQPVLSGISFAAEPGEHLAIVGRTGAGKSSLFHLLGGLYQPWEGHISLAGRSPQAMDDRERRAIVGMVPQVVQLFSGSVLDNLTLGDATLPMEAVEHAAGISGAEAFIRALPQGYATPLSASGRGAGMQLSAGQAQLLALTRALVSQPLILLLDEATSAVDSETELALKRALRIHLQQRGGVVLTIAHRLSTALEADRILVMEAGEIIEWGAPDDLIACGGRLASLWELENAGWEWREA